MSAIVVFKRAPLYLSMDSVHFLYDIVILTNGRQVCSVADKFHFHLSFRLMLVKRRTLRLLERRLTNLVQRRYNLT